MTVRKLRVKMTITMVSGAEHAIVMFPNQAEHMAKLFDRRWSWSRWVSYPADGVTLNVRRSHIESIRITPHPSLVIK